MRPKKGCSVRLTLLNLPSNEPHRLSFDLKALEAFWSSKKAQKKAGSDLLSSRPVSRTESCRSGSQSSSKADSDRSGSRPGSSSSNTDHERLRSRPGSSSSKTDPEKTRSRPGSSLSKTDPEKTRSRPGSSLSKTDSEKTGSRPGPSSSKTDADKPRSRPGPSSSKTDCNKTGSRPGPLSSKTDYVRSESRPGPLCRKTDSERSGSRPGPLSTKTDSARSRSRPGPLSRKKGLDAASSSQPDPSSETYPSKTDTSSKQRYQTASLKVDVPHEVPKLTIKVTTPEEIGSPTEVAAGESDSGNDAVSSPPQSPKPDSDNEIDVQSASSQPKSKKRARPLEDSSSDEEVIKPSSTRSRHKDNGEGEDSPRSPDRRRGTKNLRERKPINMADSSKLSGTGSAPGSAPVSQDPSSGSALSQWWAKCRSQSRAKTAESPTGPHSSQPTAEPVTEEPDLSDVEGIPELDDIEDDADPDPNFNPAAERKTRRGRRRKYYESSDSDISDEEQPSKKEQKVIKGDVKKSKEDISKNKAEAKKNKEEDKKNKKEEVSLHFICGICSAPFAGVEGLRAHHRTSDRCSKFEPGTVFKCTTCEKAFLTQTYLDEHRARTAACRLVEEDAAKKEKGSAKKGRKEDDIPSSAASVTPVAEDFDILSCSTCDKMFSSMYHLANHMKKSETCSNFKKIGGRNKESRPYQTSSPLVCKSCKVQFNSNLGLGLHLKRSQKCMADNPSMDFHSLTKSKGESSETTATAKGGVLMRGLKSNRKTDPKLETVYVCSKCYASFSSVWGLRTHERSSTNCKPDRPYEIPVPISKEKADQLKREYLKKKSEGNSGAAENDGKKDENQSSGFLMVYSPQTSDGRPIQNSTSITSAVEPNKMTISKAAAASIAQGENVCPNCGAKFSTAWGLRTHLRNSAICSEDAIQEPPYKCENCPMFFNTLAKLRDHFKTNPGCIPADGKVTEKGRLKSGQGSFLCPQCPKSFKLPTSLEQHFVEHASGDVWDCCKCKEVCTDSIELHRHFRSKHVGDWFCIMCNDKDPKVMDSFKEFYAHIFENHAKNQDHAKKYFKCQTCYRSFLSKYSLDLHVTHCRKMAEQTFTCASCNKVFSKKIHIMNHMKYAHADAIIDARYKFQCPDCPRKFLSEADWKEKHKQEGCNLQELKCDECSDIYIGKERFTLHMRLCHSKKRKTTSSKPPALERREPAGVSAIREKQEPAGFSAIREKQEPAGFSAIREKQEPAEHAEDQEQAHRPSSPVMPTLESPMSPDPEDQNQFDILKVKEEQD